MVSLVWRSAARQQPLFGSEVTWGLRLALCLGLACLVPPTSHFEKTGITLCVWVWVCVCMLKCDVSSGGKYYMGQSGVRPKECAELDQEESTQRTSMHNVNKIGHHCAYGGRVKLSVIHRFTQPRVYFICPVMHWLWKKERAEANISFIFPVQQYFFLLCN